MEPKTKSWGSLGSAEEESGVSGDLDQLITSIALGRWFTKRSYREPQADFQRNPVPPLVLEFLVKVCGRAENCLV